jgi:hypothetical protein
MTTFTATPNPATGTVQISINKTAGVSTLVRADVNGTRPVRTTAGVLPSAGAGSMGITDHEAAFHGPIAYRLDGVEIFTQFPPQMPPRFTLPFFPQLTYAVEAVTGFRVNRPQASTVHEIIGREDPIVTPGLMMSRRGSIEILFGSYDAAADVEAMFALGKTTMFRQSENLGQDCYFHPLSISPLEPDEGDWKLTVEIVALRAPTGSRASQTWTFEALAAMPGATMESVTEDYASFQTLAIGQEA